MKTPFGWSVAGPTGKKEEESKPIALSVFEFEFGRHCPEVVLHQQVEQLTEKRTNSLVNGKYKNMKLASCGRIKNPHLLNNRALAERRLRQLKKKFQRKPEFAEQYKSVMNDYVHKGYARKLTPEEAASTSDRTWYLPHHGVVNPNKSKVRVVYDATAEYGGISLNKELLQGPQLNNSLIGVLLRFRKEKVAVASDIESMFHRVACREADTDALRFLWWIGDMNEPPSDHKMTVHLFGKTDSLCIAAWALQRTAADNENEFGKEIARVVSKNFYVDDCLFSIPTIELAVRTALRLIQYATQG